MMETIRTVQTAFRLKPELLLKLKNRARVENRSLNSLVENILETSIQNAGEKEGRLYQQISETCLLNDPLPDELARLKGCFTLDAGQIEQDERLSYILRGDEDIF